MGEVIYIDEYLERKTQPTNQDLTRRLAEITLEQLLLESEKIQLERRLQEKTQ